LNLNKIFPLIILILILKLNIQADEELKPDDTKLKQMIGQMLIIGFDQSRIDKNSPVVRYIQEYNIGGVILFDRFYKDKNKIKNIRSPKQLKLLTSSLQKYSKNKLLICIDQEGGKVQRLKSSYGFRATPSAKELSKQGIEKAKKAYSHMADMLRQNGINCNFAPVVDLSINKNNPVIEGLGRSYGDSSQTVTKYAKSFMDTLESKNIIPVLKHFPGHGSSRDDSHKGFVDISDTWKEEELQPYKNLIKKQKAKMIMTAHVFNKNLDENYPATLSYKINTDLLRDKLQYKGVIVSDDLQMKAISKHYSLKDTVTLALNSGVDILLFGNQLAVQDIDELVNIIFKQVKNGSIKYKRIIESNQRIRELKKIPD
jgi:beta-N-acetylhexosaminidase